MDSEEVSGTLECQGIPNINDSSKGVDVFGSFLATRTPIALPRTDGGDEEAQTTSAQADGSDKPPLPLTATAGLLALAAAAGAGFVKFSLLVPVVGVINSPSRSGDRRKARRSHASCQTEWIAASPRSRPGAGGAGKLKSSAGNIESVMAPVVDVLAEAAAAFSELASEIDSKAVPRQQNAQLSGDKIQVVDRILDTAARLVAEKS